MPSDFTGSRPAVSRHPDAAVGSQQHAAICRRRRVADDIESAIGTYEQLLFYNPKLSRTRFELGVLYFRLGSYEMARGYFNPRCEMRDITPDLQQRAEDLISPSSTRNCRSTSSPASCKPALRYQTNPGAGPGAQTVLASGRIFDNRFFSQADWNWFGAFALELRPRFREPERRYVRSIAWSATTRSSSRCTNSISACWNFAPVRVSASFPAARSELVDQALCDRDRRPAGGRAVLRRLGRRPDRARQCRQCRARSLCRVRAAELSQFELLSARQRPERHAVDLWAAGVGAGGHTG